MTRGSETGGEDGVGNPIGELQEFTQKKLMKPPIYEFSNEQGPPHNREFVCTIKLGKFVEKGASTRYKIQDNFVHPLRKLNVCHSFVLYKHIRNCINDTFSLFQITIHSYNRSHIHSQIFLQFTWWSHHSNIMLDTVLVALLTVSVM